MLPYVQSIHFFLNILGLDKNSGDFWQYHPTIMQFDWFLIVLEKRLENHEIYYIEPTE